jgi:uncharacterized Zn-finger protein
MLIDRLAHIIRNCSTKQFEAVNRIQSHIRWCMTGTPIQNSLDDLGALIRYLKVPILGDPTSFRRHIIAPAAPTTGKDWRRPDFASLRLLLGAVCLRRTQAILSFRSRSVVTRLAFTEDEWGDYKTLEVVCKEALRMMVNSNSLRGKAAQENVLQKLLRLREFCNGIVDGDFTSPDAILRRLQQQGEVQCEYCSAAIHELESESDTVKGVQVTECHRFICTTCAPLYRVEAGNAETDKSACQFCGVRHRASNLMAKGPLPGVETVRRSPAKYPSKLLALLADVEKHVGQEKW